MESAKKWLSERSTKKNGLYLHHSLPKLVGAVPAAQLRQWARDGSSERLERAVLAGQGRRLLAETLPLPTALPALLRRCEALHAAVESGSLLQLQELLDNTYNRKKLVNCRGEGGVGLLHKAVYYEHLDTAQYLVHNYPQLVHQRDSEGRTPLHYAAASRFEAQFAALLEGAGACRAARDASGHIPAYYRGAGKISLTLPSAEDQEPKEHGLVIKRHNIRIWCHDCDMARLQRVVWEGHGSKLLSEVSNQPVVKRFLEAVPYIMNTIREIHNSVIQNDLEGLMRLTADPVPSLILSSRDSNNMTIMHKAAGLGHVSILKYISDRFTQGLNDVDNDGRTPLHYAAIVKDDQHTFETLIGLGADESAIDNKNRTPGYYTNRPQDIDKNLLKTLPDAPRTPSSAYPTSWDWKILDSEMVAEFKKKTRRKKASGENSKNNTNTISESTQNNTSMKNSSTQEHIKSLPDLEDNSRINENGVELYDMDSHKESETTENDEKEEKDEKNDESEVNDHVNNEEKNDETETDVNEESQDNSQEQEVESQEENIPNDEDENEINDDKKNEGSDSVDATDASESSPQNEKHNKDKENESQEEQKISDDNISTEVEHKLDDQEDTEKGEPEKVEVEKGEAEKGESEKDNEETNNVTEGQDEPSLPDHQTDTNEPKMNGDNEEETTEINEAHNESGIDTNEGNNKTEVSEDDDDVQVQGDTQSEYSDTNLKSTAEATTPSSAKRGNDADTGRNTQQSLIEGVVNGEPEEDSQDAGLRDDFQGDILIVDNEIDPEVSELIDTANMEMLATLVLNGEGSRLVGRRSGNLELQAFLDNVPIYMQKINKVHVAAREGSIRDLQAALDRRKFAIARDPISPNGATPLHVATIFGKTNIIKYLGGRFPETLSAVDFEGRTALHYAAVLPDNGHYFNLLQQLGANSKDLDDNGKSAENYQDDPSLLSYENLLSDFGINDEAAHQMLSDKVPEDRVSSRRTLDTPEALDTLERCYKLLASAKLPRTPLSASSNKSTPPLVLGRFLKRSTFEIIKDRITKLDHDLFDVIWPAVKKLPENRNVIQTVEEDFPGGVTAPDYYVYEVFSEFLIPLIKDLHNINVGSELPLHPTSNFIKTASVTESVQPLVELNVDTTDEYVLSGTIECSRNINGFELPINLKIGELETIERIITTILTQEDFTTLNEPLNLKSDQKGGTYYTLNEVLEKPSEICATLASSNLLVALCDREEIDDCTRLHGRHWPYGRGVFLNEDKTVAIWINVHDHIRVIISTPEETPGEIGLPYSKMTNIMTYLHDRLDFVWHHILGHLSSRPTYLGAGIRFNLIVNFPGLSKDPENMKQLCAMRGLQYRETLSNDIARISNYQCLSMSESSCFNDFSTATSNLLHLERDISMQSSAHIASMLTNIFKRKRSSLVDTDAPENNTQ